jgi:hypothetical protein
MWHISGKFFRLPRDLNFSYIENRIRESIDETDGFKVIAQTAHQDMIDDDRDVTSWIIEKGMIQLIHIKSTESMFIDILLFDDWKFSHAFVLMKSIKTRLNAGMTYSTSFRT